MYLMHVTIKHVKGNMRNLNSYFFIVKESIGLKPEKSRSSNGDALCRFMDVNVKAKRTQYNYCWRARHGKKEGEQDC